MTEMLAIPNATAVPLDDVPLVGPDAFHDAIVDAIEKGHRLSALFGSPHGDNVAIHAVLADDASGLLRVAQTIIENDRMPSLVPACTEAHLFEREIAEQWGVVPIGHPWLKPLRFHTSYRPGHDAWGRSPDAPPTVGVMDFFRVDGEEVHEVAVGPVHAGVIEPGHFRFQCFGEQVFHLEISLGYQHRGVERRLIGGPDKRTIHYMETLSGDATIGHATAYAEVVEAIAGRRATSRSYGLRAITLELERLANHTGDLGALAGDVGFLPTASFCGRLRGDFLNMTALVCGNRFGRGMVRPGGVAFDLDDAQIADLHLRLDAAEHDVAAAAALLWSTPSVMARFEETGRVTAETARALGLVGPAARACGLQRDVRKTHPSGIYQLVHVPISTVDTGDVFARAYVRWLEIERSVAYIRMQLEELARGALHRELPALRPRMFAVALAEAWRGEVCHVAITDEHGRFAAYKVVDPSFHNWTGLAMSLRDQQISDFPLCNKSFNLSYCGHDL